MNMRTHRETIADAEKAYDLYMNKGMKLVYVAQKLNVSPSTASAEIKKYIEYLDRVSNPVFAAIIDHCSDMPAGYANGLIKALSWKFRPKYKCTLSESRKYAAASLTPQIFVNMSFDDIMSLRGIGEVKGTLLLQVQEKFKEKHDYATNT